MKKIIIALILLNTVASSLKAQDKKVSFQFPDRWHRIMDVFPMGNDGFLLRTSQKIKYYDMNLNLKMEKSIISKNAVFPNASGSKLFDIKNLGHLKKESVITQINLDGTTKEVVIKKGKWKTISEGHIKAAFGNDSLICYLVTKNGEEWHSTKKVDEEMIFYKVNFNNSADKKVTLKLPRIKTDPKKTSFWSYETHNEEAFYLSSTYTEKVVNGVRVNINVIKLNYNGDILKESTISFDRDNVSKLNATHSSSHLNDSFRPEATHSSSHLNDSFRPEVSSRVKGRRSHAYVSSSSSDCQIKIDEKKELIYVFGLEQHSSNIKENDQRSYFIKKYNFNGKLIWENNVDMKIGRHTFFVGLEIEKNQNIKLEFYANKNMTVWAYTKDGELISDYLKKGKIKLIDSKVILKESIISGNYIPKNNSPAAKYFKNCKSREHIYMSFKIENNKSIFLEYNDENFNVDMSLYTE
ncbi:MAG: hypothetical protein COB15_03055 [Flavobacteriales bacterium]|nr:MAG: hypothetical protein COB15_03055 [Flavobacteriales bacterium]